MSNLTVSIQEKITLPNNNIETAINTVTIPGINQFVRRIDTIPYDFEGTGVGIISFVNSESTQTPGSFVNSDVKYIRITNLVVYRVLVNLQQVVFNMEEYQIFH